MTPEQKQFYEKLGDALAEVREDLEDNPEYMTDFDYDLMRVTKAAQKLHDLCPTLCEPEWQPIETAPKDGTKFFGYNGFVRRDVMWSDKRQGFDVNGFSPMNRGYTHWMPQPEQFLPEPPTISKAAGGNDE